MTTPGVSDDTIRRLQSLLLGGRPRVEGVPTLRVLASQPRSGTHWLKSMISTASGQAALPARLHEPEALHAAIAEHGDCLLQEHFKFSLAGSILTPKRHPNLRMLILFRHPLDALISNFHYRRHVTKREPRWSADAEPTPRDHLRELCATGRWRNRLRDQVVAWIETGHCYPIRYEDLVAAPEAELARALAFLDVRTSTAALRRAVERNRFEVLSGGRARGVDDPTSHYRRGVPGEWRAIFGEEDRALARRAIGDVLTLLGYGLD